MTVVWHGYDGGVSCHAWRILHTTNTDNDVGGSCHPAVQRVHPLGRRTSGVIRRVPCELQQPLAPTPVNGLRAR
jgi:hypothetical protein